MKLKIAIQKSGRLSEDSLKLLKSCGIQFNNGISSLKTEALNFPLEVLFLRDDDIPEYVCDNIAHIGIIGENVLLEQGTDIEILRRLEFGKCKLSIAVPKTFDYSGAQDLNGKKIATSYPSILKKFLEEQKVEAEIHLLKGSVEIAPNVGLADMICDLVSSGSTLFTNGLKEAEVVLRSEAVLVGNHTIPAQAKKLLDKLLFRINAVKAASSNKYILLNCPNEKLEQIVSILPGMNSPTVIPLMKSGWSSLHSVISENDFWENIENLKENGAEGILVLPIEKMIR